MAADDLLIVLTRANSGSQVDLDHAQEFLTRNAATDLSKLLKDLSDILSNVTNIPAVRAQAAIQLKNAIDSRDENLKQICHERWININDNIRNHIKRNCFNALGTETVKPSQAARCIGCIACIELPRGQWSDLIQCLVDNVIATDKTDNVREASLEALGYTCQDIVPDILEPQSDVILTAIARGMHLQERNEDVQLAATKAMLNSLEFSKNNFKKDEERHRIMQIVCEATQSKNLQIKITALKILVKILSLYYDYMEFYMGPGLYPITVEAMKSTEDDVALQGIEFWSNICDEEYELQLLQQEAQEQNRQPERISRCYARAALVHLTPILLQRLTMQDDADDDDDWNPCKAAGVCLMLLANCVENDIIDQVFPFISQNIRHDDWKYREASVMAFGAILEGPDVTSIKLMSEQGLPFLLELLRDSCIAVRDTTAWTIGRIFEFASPAVMSDQSLRIICPILVNSLRDEPRVATNICWSFSSLARAVYEHAEYPEDDETPNTYLLSPFFEDIVKVLIETTDRPDGNKSNLRNAAYEALMEMIRNSPKDCYITVQKTTLTILDRLNRVIAVENHATNSNDRVQLSDLQSLLCATLQSVLRKVHPNDAPLISDPIMQALLQMLKTSNNKTSNVREDALIALGTLIEVLGMNFLKYIDHVLPFIYESLQNPSEYQICSAAVSVVSDLSRSLMDKLIPYCDQIMTYLMMCLSNDKLHRKVKPQIITTFGDIALAISGHFKIYLEHVLNILNQACRAQISNNDYEMIEYLNELRESCLSTYTSIVQGLRNSSTPNDLNSLANQLPLLIQFLETVARDPNKTDSVLSNSIGLIGDLVISYGQVMLQFVERDTFEKLFLEGKRSKISKTKTLTNWTTKEIRKLKRN